MRSIRSGFKEDAYNPAEDDARWEAYRALMRKTGDIKVLPGLDDEPPDDTWRAAPPVAVEAADGVDTAQCETEVPAEAEASTEHLSHAPPIEVAAPVVESVAADLGLARPRIDPRGRKGLIAGGAALIALLVLAAANVLGPGPRHDMRPPAPAAPAGRAATTGVARAAIPFQAEPQAKPGPAARSSAVKHHRTPRHPAKRIHARKAVHRPKTWAAPYPWADQRWDSGLSGGAAVQPRP